MQGYGPRIREERQRLKLTQADFASLSGVSRQSQANYEVEEREPGAAYLIKLHDHVDVPYILSGERSKTSDIDVKAVETILNEMDAWAVRRKQPPSQEMKAELVVLFLNQAMRTGKVEVDWIKQTLRLVT